MTRSRARGDASRRVLIAAAIALAAACRDPESERLRATTQASYDRTTGKLTELTSDANRNGTVDTWTEMDGARPVRSRSDRNEDGRLDRWEYYDASGRLAKVGLSRADDGTPDAWAFAGADGRIARIEVSSVRDETKVDRWEYYLPAAGGGDGVLARVEEDTNRDGRKDKWERFEGGALTTAEFDGDGDGRPDRRLTYRGAELVRIEHTPDASGHYTQSTSVK
jgi:hypothetical protein